MRYGIDVPQFGDYGDARTLAELAREAEQAGWDGFFIWDHINVNWPTPVADPWIALAAIASATARIRIGALVTPLFRRNPWKLARETVTLDHLSQGRLIVGVGLASDVFEEISSFNGPLDDRVRAEMLEEGLAILTGLWSGEKFAFAGKHYQVQGTQFLPLPIQKPHIPIWVAGTWPRKPPFRRAARFDGVVPMSGDIEQALKPAQIADIKSFIASQRTTNAPFDIVIAGETDPAQAREITSAYEAAGATWWLESTLPWKQSLADFRRRIMAGPPFA
ncbi:MAG TPA: LLM class flavin-dependent oxidoreductase [Candidatus Binataceae bacterium]|nr:LLM class flavin-dependent oxidoreductase [Candidatus Binataceae bacterium]